MSSAAERAGGRAPFIRALGPLSRCCVGSNRMAHWVGSNSMAHLLGKPGAASSKSCNSLLARRGGALGLLVACFHLLFVSVRWRRWFSLVLVGYRVWVFSTLAAHSAVFARSRASSFDFVSFVGSRRRSWVFIGARWVFVGFRWLPSVSVGCRLRCQS